MTRKNFFDTARAIAGGKLTQAQVDDLNKLVDKFAPSSMTTSDVSIVLISGFEDTRFKAYDDGVGVWTIGTGTTVYPNGVKVKQGNTCTP
ncbi:lysozyme from bacteriophage [Acinetobacter baumannii]|nr:putative lysozyme [Acinetobacter baumannii 1267820]EXC67887.1 putative lysozyme [Acinetobacter baumannii 1043794]EXD89145.1 putative lysozyme [Acinetobacter baumannii 972082]EXE92357.1 putative lysozyme [Acinetobacter baumannii 232184]EXF06451.1 putative lysozyme [Acinetobacter baumannii 268680]EXG99442.1 putative lysozyme [Acinetobacter baumannii 1064293_45]EYT15427.1 putative lysozyme [Acinetobacter baumannii 655378]SSI78265.1 Phage-related lysozyme (muraminidase) [Acinetobacter baumann